jgi:hypothetical protein
MKPLIDLTVDEIAEMDDMAVTDMLIRNTVGSLHEALGNAMRGRYCINVNACDGVWLIQAYEFNTAGYPFTARGETFSLAMARMTLMMLVRNEQKRLRDTERGYLCAEESNERWKSE